jgi:hypothetical protein
MLWPRAFPVGVQPLQAVGTHRSWGSVTTLPHPFSPVVIVIDDADNHQPLGSGPLLDHVALSWLQPQPPHHIPLLSSSSMLAALP